MTSRYLIHKTMIKLVKEVIFLVSRTAQLLKSAEVSEQALTNIQQGVYDIATYTQKLFSVSSKDEDIEKVNKDHFEKIEGVLKSVSDALENKRAEPSLRRDLDQLDEDIKQVELEEFEELKSDWRLQTHLKEVIDKLEVYKKEFLQFYANKRDGLALLMREIALHMAAVLKLLDIDIREDKEIMMHLKHAHLVVNEATPPKFAKVWEVTKQKEFIEEVVALLNEQIKQEAKEKENSEQS